MPGPRGSRAYRGLLGRAIVSYFSQMREKDWIAFTLYAAGIVGALIWLAIFT